MVMMIMTTSEHRIRYQAMPGLSPDSKKKKSCRDTVAASQFDVFGSRACSGMIDLGGFDFLLYSISGYFTFSILSSRHHLFFAFCVSSPSALGSRWVSFPQVSFLSLSLSHSTTPFLRRLSILKMSMVWW